MKGKQPTHNVLQTKCEVKLEVSGTGDVTELTKKLLDILKQQDEITGQIVSVDNIVRVTHIK